MWKNRERNYRNRDRQYASYSESQPIAGDVRSATAESDDPYVELRSGSEAYCRYKIGPAFGENTCKTSQWLLNVLPRSHDLPQSHCSERDPSQGRYHARSEKT